MLWTVSVRTLCAHLGLCNAHLDDPHLAASKRRVTDQTITAADDQADAAQRGQTAARRLL